MMTICKDKITLRKASLAGREQTKPFEKMKRRKMTTELTTTKQEEKVNVQVHGGSSGAVYGLGLIGACVYYIGRANTPREKALGFLKALVWPAFMVYELFLFLHKE